MTLIVDGTTGVTFNDASLQGAAASPFVLKNRIINGGMAINQRGATLSTTNSQGYFIDRMWGFSGVSTAATFSQQSSSGLAGFPFFARAQRTSGNTGTAGVYFGQIIESNNLQDLQGQSVTVSFWARAGANYSAVNSILTVFLRTGTVADQGLNTTISPGWTGQVDQTSNVTLTTSWQRFSTTFTVASNIQEMTTFFYNATSGTAGAADFFDVTGIQLEIGTTATPFERRLYGQELMLCQRYFQIRRNGSIFSGTVGAFGFAGSSGTGVATLTTSLPVEMRAFPTVAYTGTVALNRNQANYPITSLSNYMGTSSGFVDVTVASGLSGGDGVLLVGVADAASISFSSEL